MGVGARVAVAVELSEDEGRECSIATGPCSMPARGSACMATRDIPSRDWHPMPRLRLAARMAVSENWLAVTAACMMVERSKFVAVGGFDESFVVAGNDADLCLRLTTAGHRSLCVPHALLVHDESSSRGAHIDPGDFVRSAQSYGEFRTVGDPFYNPNLTLRRTDCSVRVPGEAPA